MNNNNINNNINNIKRPHPIDKNICLYIYDIRPIMIKSKSINKITKTQELNKWSNFISRAILYGNKDEKDVLIDAIEYNIPSFALRWTQGDVNSQEIRYLRGLKLLLQVGITKAEEAVSNPIISINQSNNPSIRLFDSYLNAFHRVIEGCLSEISTRSSNYNYNNNNNNMMISPNDDILLAFVQWEQSLRSNLTSSLAANRWKLNPSELAGTWDLVDVKGDGGLRSLLVGRGSYNYQSPNDGREARREDREGERGARSFPSIDDGSDDSGMGTNTPTPVR
jgi:hypothetical protein